MESRFAFMAQQSLRNVLRLPFIIDLSKIEIEITTACNLACNNCDRSCGQAKSAEQMSIDQIAKFIDESVRSGKKWKRITILGGEPLLHGDALQIVQMIADYKRRHSRQTFLRVITNGWGRRVRSLMQQIPEEAYVSSTEKVPRVVSRQLWQSGATTVVFDTTHVAPIDVPGVDCSGLRFSSGCSIPENCGIALTRYGFFPCGAGASVARVFGLDVGVRSLADVSVAQCRSAMDRLCRLCGHFKSRSRYTFHGVTALRSTEQITSRTWQEAFDRYALGRPCLRLY
jgi:hypothetical protein